MMRIHVSLIVLLLSGAFVRSDTCGIPTTTAISSDDGSIIVRIDPGSGDAPGRAKVECIATITKWSEQDRSYHFVQRVALRNPRRPLTAVITKDARFLVTFDDWCEAGETENAVVIYDLRQGTSHSHSIESFLPQSYRRTLVQSISSTFWRSDVGTEDEQKVYVLAPRPITTDHPWIIIDPAKDKITCEECGKPER
jgi:hypothetical protein